MADADEWLKARIDETRAAKAESGLIAFGFSERLLHGLLNAGATAATINQFTDTQLLSVYGFGKQCLRELRATIPKPKA